MPGLDHGGTGAVAHDPSPEAGRDESRRAPCGSAQDIPARLSSVDSLLAAVRGRHLGWLLLAGLFAVLGVLSTVTFLSWVVSAFAAIPDWSLVLASAAAAGLQLVSIVFCYWVGVGAWRRSDPRR